MIILTGAAGFIGSCLLWRLNQEGQSNILIVDHLDGSGKEKNLEDKKFKGRFLFGKGDIILKQKLKETT